MKISVLFVFLFTLGVFISGCYDPVERVKPVLISDAVPYDTDDPAIWIHPTDPTQSLVLGTDKGGDTDQGGLYVFSLDGTIDHERSFIPLNRPNNVDIAYNMVMGSDTLDIAVVTIRRENAIRVFSLPDMMPIDNGGISVFVGETDRDPMGISLFTDLGTGTIYVMVGRKLGPSGSYIWQYELTDSGEGFVGGKLVRQFGQFSGLKEIEALVSDNELGYLYASDEGFGVRKYYAHPDSSSDELATFAFDNVKEDHEGLSIYRNMDGTGYLILSDQQGQRFNLYTREGDNSYLRSVPSMAVESDGNDITSAGLNPSFPNGLFVAMSDDKTFQFYRAEDIIGTNE